MRILSAAAILTTGPVVVVGSIINGVPERNRDSGRKTRRQNRDNVGGIRENSENGGIDNGGIFSRNLDVNCNPSINETEYNEQRIIRGLGRLPFGSPNLYVLISWTNFSRNSS